MLKEKIPTVEQLEAGDDSTHGCVPDNVVNFIRLKLGQKNFQKIFPCIEGGVFGGNAKTIISLLEVNHAMMRVCMKPGK